LRELLDTVCRDSETGSASPRHQAIVGAASGGSVYERAEYLAASARHVGAAVEVVQEGQATFPLLRYPDGSLRTVYGLPRPYGSTEVAAIRGLRDGLRRRGWRLTAILSPFEPGPALATELCARGAHLLGERPICIAELAPDNPQRPFHSRAARAIGTAAKRGATAEVSPLTPWFGAFYRAAMVELAAEPVYFFADEYFHALADLPHYQVTVSDQSGPAAGALFLHDDDEAYYHLGARRARPQAVVGAMSMALGEGICEARRRGCRVAILGGGRTDALDDPLYTFKQQLATRVQLRHAVQLDGGGER